MNTPGKFSQHLLPFSWLLFVVACAGDWGVAAAVHVGAGRPQLQPSRQRSQRLRWPHGERGQPRARSVEQKNAKVRACLHTTHLNDHSPCGSYGGNDNGTRFLSSSSPPSSPPQVMLLEDEAGGRFGAFCAAGWRPGNAFTAPTAQISASSSTGPAEGATTAAGAARGGGGNSGSGGGSDSGLGFSDFGGGSSGEPFLFTLAPRFTVLRPKASGGDGHFQ